VYKYKHPHDPQGNSCFCHGKQIKDCSERGNPEDQYSFANNEKIDVFRAAINVSHEEKSLETPCFSWFSFLNSPFISPSCV